MRRVLFVHVMKTGGTSLRRLFLRKLPVGALHPDGDDMLQRYTDPRAVLDLRAVDAAAVRVLAGHVPAYVAELLDPPAQVVTVLRDPVERAVSHLKQLQRLQYPDLSLEAVYDDPYLRAMYLADHQTKVFALEATDGTGTIADSITIDEARYARAAARLEAAAIVGVQDRYDEFAGAVAALVGFRVKAVPRARVSPPAAVPATLRRRIEADNAADAELFRLARSLADRTRPLA